MPCPDRRIAGTALLLTLILSCVVGIRKDAFAAISKGPYVQNVTDASIVVCWETSTALAGSVQYGPTPDLGLWADGAEASTQHEISLSGLAAGSLYYYRVISEADTSAVARLQTAVEPSRPFRFFAFGDNRTNSGDHQAVVDQMLTVPGEPPGLLVNVGDLTATGSDSDYQIFFQVEAPLIDHVPLFPCLGNHDLGNLTNYQTFFALPNNERWYSFRYGNSSFHALDTESPIAPGSEQYDWIVQELMADSADVSIRHVVVYLHDPPYTTNLRHSSNLEVRQYICPLLERFRVSVTFQGHNHCYEHSLVNGVHYLLTGGGGAPLYYEWGPEQPWTVCRKTCLEFVQVDVAGDTLTVQTIEVGGAVIDSFEVVEPTSGVRGASGSAGFSVRLTVEPNPAYDAVRIGYVLPRAGDGVLSIFDAQGRKVDELLSATLPAGEGATYYRTRQLSGGTYFAVLRTAQDRRVTQFVVVR